MAHDRHSERRLVTCVFIDVVGSTDMTVRLGPERMKRELDRAFGQLRDIFSSHGGTIEKYIGDAIFVLFGAPTAHADDAERALRAARACCDWAAGQGAGSSAVGVRLGVETGEALVDLDALDTQQQMAVGAVVNVAARLQSLAEPGEVLVGPRCREATAHVATFTGERILDLKGIGPTSVAALGAIAAPTTRIFSVPFVGRAAELSILSAAFERARSRHATFVLVSGPPGQGKSRLVEEFLATLPANARVLSARCRPGTESGSLTPLRQLLLSDVGEDAPEAVERRLGQVISGPDRAHVLDVISHSAGLRTSERLLQLSAIQRRDEFVAAWRRYVVALAGMAPVIIWVEDLHWAEPHLVTIIDRLIRGVEAEVLVVGTARPEFVGSASLRPGEDLVHLELAGLGPDAALELARSASTTAIRTIERAEGNPLFIVELARARRVSDDLPMTVQAAIAARIDELAPSDRELLQHAAIVGETFGVRDAALLTDREATDAAGALARLAHGRYLSTVNGRYRFHHALVRDVAYGRVPVASRMRLHARYAREGVDPQDADALTHHWWEALRPPDAEWAWEGTDLLEMRRAALEAHLVAASRRADRLSHDRAVELYGHALELADGPLAVARVEEGLGRAYARNAQGDQAWAHRLTAIDSYRAAGNDPPAAFYADMLAVPVLNFGYFLKRPTPERVSELLAEGERIARASGEEGALMRLIAERSVFTGDAGAADEALTLAASSQDRESLSGVFLYAACAQLFAGELAAAEATFQRIAPLAAEGRYVNTVEVLMWHALVRITSGELSGATAIADELDALTRSAPPHTQGHALGVRGTIQAAQGKWEQVQETAGLVAQLVMGNPALPFCLVPAAATAAAAIGERLAARPYADDTTALVERMITIPSWKAATLLLPRIMSGEPGFGPDVDTAYGGWPSWVRQVWDPLGFGPAIGVVMLGRWDELGTHLERLDRAAARGSRLAGALTAAMREELAASQGGARPIHADLKAIGCDGYSQMLRFRADRPVGDPERKGDNHYH